MLQGIERLVDLTGPRAAALEGMPLPATVDAVRRGDVGALAATRGHFGVVARDGQTIRLARTLGQPLRYFVAKMYHGPFLIVADRIDRIFAWCCEQQIGWQFDPAYTRMLPAHYLVEIEQLGCPDPSPRYTRFFDPPVGQGTRGLQALGADYVQAAYDGLAAWLAGHPDGQPVGLAFSGGVDSTSILLLARQALAALGRSPSLLRAFTLDLGGGPDAEQAGKVVQELGLEENWEPVRLPGQSLDLEAAIAEMEDYHPLDVECAAAGLALLGAVRERHPGLRFFLDGDGGDENLKSYPLEDSDLTLPSVLKNPLLYQEGWGVDAMKHSLTYSGGLSRSYVRTYAPARRYGFEAFSPYTTRAAIAASLAIPFEGLLAGDARRLEELKGEVVQAGVEAVTGIRMPVLPKRRFQDGVAGGSYRRWRVGKAWCRQVFLRQWEDRLRAAWEPEAGRRSGNQAPAASG